MPLHLQSHTIRPPLIKTVYSPAWNMKNLKWCQPIILKFVEYLGWPGWHQQRVNYFDSSLLKINTFTRRANCSTIARLNTLLWILMSYKSYIMCCTRISFMQCSYITLCWCPTNHISYTAPAYHSWSAAIWPNVDVLQITYHILHPHITHEVQPYDLMLINVNPWYTAPVASHSAALSPEGAHQILDVHTYRPVPPLTPLRSKILELLRQ